MVVFDSHFLFQGAKVIVSCAIVIGLIYSVRKWYRRMRFMRSGIHQVDQMQGIEFEYYLQGLFEKVGYSASVTQSSGDFGADLIIEADEKIVIQAKRYSGNVGLAAVQEIYAAKAYYQADDAWVMTNSHYTKNAKLLASACDVRLIDRKELMQFIDDVKHKY